MREVVIVDSVRTGLAKSFRGKFNLTRPDDMAAHCVDALLARNDLDPLPAVTEPSSANAGFSEARPSRVVSGRLQSSRSTTPSSTCFSPLALSSTA